ncbi:unnamed protein product, partial [Rotaria sordida]
SSSTSSTIILTQSSTSSSSTTEQITNKISSSTIITAVTTTTTTLRPPVCVWTSWVPITNCTADCGPAYRLIRRFCVDSTTGQNCNIFLCGGGIDVQNEICSSSPPCETTVVVPPISDRDPTIRIISYALPDTMYFFEQTYRRIWISNKGYITFDTPYYAQTMENFAFHQIQNQAIAAPFWANLSYVAVSNIFY